MTETARVMPAVELSGKQIPAASGWTTWPPSDKPQLVGSRCKSCGDYFFPKVGVCSNPACMGEDLDEVPLSRTGKLYTYAVNYYKPPAPYVPPDPFVPYATAIIELDREKMKVQGMVVSNCDFTQLKIGMDMETVLEPLYRDAEGNDVMVWKFRPA
ncbi:MAG: benzoylsuccinyl-CoA thiolase [Chloroflexota bacterium]|nr:MAG: benzoylsuccinyl-CoA thiolase [Chloroflexota bacterium]